MSRLRDDIVLASIAALSALTGTAVGAFVTYEGDRQLQNRELKQEEARQTTSARAVARLLSSEYQADVNALEYMITNNKYDPLAFRDRTFVSKVGQEDRKMLAGSVTERAWVAVSEASRQVQVVAGELEAHRGEGSISAEAGEILESVRAACVSAYDALTPLAEGKSS
jgi:hypothetical protein